jgi:hypothetical protein
MKYKKKKNSYENNAGGKKYSQKKIKATKRPVSELKRREMKIVQVWTIDIYLVLILFSYNSCSFFSKSYFTYIYIYISTGLLEMVADNSFSIRITESHRKSYFC